MRWFFLTVGYSGLSKYAPGTAGSVVALLLAVLILHFFTIETLFLLTLLATVAGIKLIDAHEQESQTHDDKRIVIDELAGLWLALCIAPGTSIVLSDENTLLSVLLSFLFFRIYDIKKPSIIGRIDKETKGGIGVMGDDLLAGIAAGVSSALVMQFYHQLLS